MKMIFNILLLFAPIAGIGQICYVGQIDKYPITLIMYHYNDGMTQAYYVYDKYDTPIKVNGTLKNDELKLFESNEEGAVFATLIFEKYDKNDTQIRGKWVQNDNLKSYSIALKKDFEINAEALSKWENRELLQSASTKKHYFKIIISKENKFTRISGVKIFEKKSDKLIQTIELDCELFGIDNVSVGDYNFDGIQDFSVFEASYSGPNTSSVYILWNPDLQKYINSNFSGTSLEFDQELKLIYEHNQCCAGRIHTIASYKVENNKMILIEKTCQEYSEEHNSFIETKCD